ncbi:hypothetical protein Gorai_024252 [Gossypium raimondii]|uniref:DUF4283 domain-containing protein n=1 Tax=Gossypium raimondii TaxID=29730 RepID=A0A7J8NZ52_GOSRA|nr:hypothetical protein [Gossypium raimondii]
MEEKLANPNLLDEEEDAFREEAPVVDNEYQFCLVRVISRTLMVFQQSFADFAQESIEGLLVLLSSTEFWVQVHYLPPSLMLESMAKQFGNFLGMFLEYDTSTQALSFQKFMRIRIKLDVNLLLKRKKKVLVELSLRSSFRVGYFSPCGGEKKNLNRESMVARGGWDRDSRRKRKGKLEQYFPNPNFIPLGFEKEASIMGIDHRQNMDIRDISWAETENGPIDMVFDGDNDSLYTLKGKKRQLVEQPNAMKLLSWNGCGMRKPQNDNENGETWKLMGFYGNPDERNKWLS